MSKDILDDILGAEVEAPNNEVSKDDIKVVKEKPKKTTQKKVDTDKSVESNSVSEEESTKEVVTRDNPVEAISIDDNAKAGTEGTAEAKVEIGNEMVKTEPRDVSGEPKDIKFPRRMVVDRPVTLYRAPNSNTAYTQISGSIVVTGPNVGDYSPITAFISGGVGRITGYIFSPIRGRMS